MTYIERPAETNCFLVFDSELAADNFIDAVDAELSLSPSYCTPRESDGGGTYLVAADCILIPEALIDDAIEAGAVDTPRDDLPGLGWPHKTELPIS